MGNSKDTLVVIYRSLMVGGIENYVTSLINNALSLNKRVVWVCHTKKLYSPVYKSIVEDKRLEIINTDFSSINLYKLPKIDLSDQGSVKIMVFDIFRLFQAYKLKEKHKNINVDILYCVPHFTGLLIFPEQGIKYEIIKKITRNIFSKIYDRIFKEGNLYFFSPKHHETLQNNYGIYFSSPQDYLVPKIIKREEYDEESFRNVYRSKSFTIISPGRFEFPHKGYLLGLIRAYGKVKPKYPHLKLLIIGDGQDKDKVETAISNLPEKSKKGIILKSSLSYEELKKIMKTVNLNISVAGCASMGARIGLITLPARHYNYDCEVYGFFPESRSLTTETKPGFPVEPYIEKVINMDEEEYIYYSKLAYHTFDDEQYCPNFPFDKRENSIFVPSKTEFIFVWFTYNLQRLFHHITKLYVRLV